MSLAVRVGTVRHLFFRLLTQRLGAVTDRPFQHLRAVHAIGTAEVHTQTELARRLLIDAPAASRLVDRLARDGLIERCAGRDRRCVRLTLTPKGQKELRLITRELEAMDHDLATRVPPQNLRAFLTGLEKVEAALQLLAGEVLEPPNRQRTPKDAKRPTTRALRI